MRRSLSKALTVSAGLSLALMTGAEASGAGSPSPARQAMKHCVDRVLAVLARSRAPDGEVGTAVLARCDAPLRAALADAIRRGEASFCTVESCLFMARQRASSQATATYRRLMMR